MSDTADEDAAAALSAAATRQAEASVDAVSATDASSARVERTLRLGRLRLGDVEPRRFRLESAF